MKKRQTWASSAARHFAAAAFVATAYRGPAEPQNSLPALDLPDKKIIEVYRGNWVNTLLPCQLPAAQPGNEPPNQGAEPLRPWKVDLKGHYPGWYPGVDVKHVAASYLACEKNLPLVLRAWDLTRDKYLMADGGVRPMTLFESPHNVVPETTVDGSVVFYPLRMTANIDFILLGDMIFRFSQDKRWLTENLPPMRRAAAFIEAWMDDEGLLHSDSYDLDQVYREIDGVAQSSAFLALSRLAVLEDVAGNDEQKKHAEFIAKRLGDAAEKHFWSSDKGYYYEHLVHNNIARIHRGGSILAASSELDEDHAAAKAIDGVAGMGIDAFGVGKGAAGAHEWAAKNETVGAWIQVSVDPPTRIGKVILYNRTDPKCGPRERFASGYLEFSDGSPQVEVAFNSLDISRAVASFAPREASWVKFTGTRMQGSGGANAGLAEFLILPADEPYQKISHGMTDTNFAMVAFGAAEDAHAAAVWQYFREHESAFYEVNGLFAPTWIAEKADAYAPSQLNRRAPRKDCVAMGRTWRYDALMRRRMHDGEGLFRTITYVNALYDRPSGGGVGLFAERYGLGRFQPGDESQANVPAYTEYPAVYNSTVIQQALLGLDIDARGTITIDPCVPAGWYDQGFGAEGCGVLKDHDLGFKYQDDKIEGWMSGPAGQRKMQIRVPPGLASCRVISNGKTLAYERIGDFVTFELPLSERGRTAFVVKQ